MNIIELRFMIHNQLTLLTVSTESIKEYYALLSFYQHDDRISEIVVRNLRCMHQETVYTRVADKWQRACK